MVFSGAYPERMDHLSLKVHYEQVDRMKQVRTFVCYQVLRPRRSPGSVSDSEIWRELIEIGLEAVEAQKAQTETHKAPAETHKETP